MAKYCTFFESVYCQTCLYSVLEINIWTLTDWSRGLGIENRFLFRFHTNIVTAIKKIKINSWTVANYNKYEDVIYFNVLLISETFISWQQLLTGVNAVRIDIVKIFSILSSSKLGNIENLWQDEESWMIPSSSAHLIYHAYLEKLSIPGVFKFLLILIIYSMFFSFFASVLDRPETLDLPVPRSALGA